MRIRKCASRLLGSAAPALPRFEELPPPSPPPAHAGSVAASGTSSSLEPCKLSLSPWDLMDQLHLSDPQEEKIFLETYLVAVAWRASWLFQPSMPTAGSIKEEEQQREDMAVDAVDDGVIFELRICKKNAVRNKKEMKPNMNKEKIKAEKSDATAARGETPVWTCKKNSGKTWFCRRPVSQPNSFCSYHSDQKPKRKRATDVGEGFYYYAGFGSWSKRHRISSSSDGVPEPQPAGQKEEAPPDPEEHIGFITVQAKADGADHQAAPPVHVDEPMSNDSTAGIAGCDEESSDDDVVEPRDIKRKSPLKKRWRKPVKARSLKSLMY